jgi:DNA-binding Lrp family transcriptional regulator
VTGADLARALNVPPGAMCNRLRSLEKLGFARGTRYGRKVLWEAITEQGGEE